MTSSEFKQRAKATLKQLPGKQQLFFIPILFYLALTAIQIHQNYMMEQEVVKSLFATIFPTILNILASLFALSATFTMLKVIQHKQTKVSFNDLTLSFSNHLFWKIILMEVIKWLLLFVWSLIFLSGLVLVGVGVYLGSKSTGPQTLWLVMIGTILMIIGGAISINRQYAYSQTSLILFEQVEKETYIGVVDIIDRSVALTKGYKWKNFLLHLSFLGWFILIFFSFGLLLFYVYPYFITSELYFYENLKALKTPSTPS